MPKTNPTESTVIYHKVQIHPDTNENGDGNPQGRPVPQQETQTVINRALTVQRPNQNENNECELVVILDPSENEPFGQTEEKEHSSIRRTNTESELGLSGRRDTYGVPEFDPEPIENLAGIRNEIDRIRKHYIHRLGKRKNHNDQFGMLMRMFACIENRLQQQDALNASGGRGFSWRDLAGGLVGGSIGSMMSFGTQTWTDHAMTASRNSSGTSFLPGAGLFGATYGIGRWTARSIARLLSQEKLPDPLPIRRASSHGLGSLVNEVRDQYAPILGIYSAAYFVAGMLGTFDGQFSYGVGGHDRDNRGTKLAERRTATAIIAGSLAGMVSSCTKAAASRAQIQSLYSTNESGQRVVDMAWVTEMVLAMQYEEFTGTTKPDCCRSTLIALKDAFYTGMPAMILAKQSKNLEFGNPDTSLEKGFNGALGMMSFLAGWSLLHGAGEALIRYTVSRDDTPYLDVIEEACSRHMESSHLNTLGSEQDTDDKEGVQIIFEHELDPAPKHNSLTLDPQTLFTEIRQYGPSRRISPNLVPIQEGTVLRDVSRDIESKQDENTLEESESPPVPEDFVEPDEESERQLQLAPYLNPEIVRGLPRQSSVPL